MLQQEEWNLKHKDKASAASMERVQHFGESFAKIQEATGKLFSIFKLLLFPTKDASFVP